MHSRVLYHNCFPPTAGIHRTLAWLEEDSTRQVINPETEKKLDKVVERYEMSFR